MLTAYAPHLLCLAREAGDEPIIGGVKPDRRSVTTGLLGRVEGGADLPQLEPARLRSTWIATHLRAGVRIDVLMEAAGLSGPATLADLARYLDASDPATANALLRGDVRDWVTPQPSTTAPLAQDRTVRP
ncbi:MAG: hypothetical protein ACYCU7_07080 [Acidimicrobiales bacterium]